MDVTRKTKMLTTKEIKNKNNTNKSTAKTPARKAVIKTQKKGVVKKESGIKIVMEKVQTKITGTKIPSEKTLKSISNTKKTIARKPENIIVKKQASVMHKKKDDKRKIPGKPIKIKHVNDRV